MTPSDPDSSRSEAAFGRAPLSADLLPASGAWKPGDPTGDRQYVELAATRTFALEGGGMSRIDDSFNGATA